MEGTHTGYNFHTDLDDTRDEWRRLAAELLGTFLLTFVAAGGGVIAAVSPGEVSRAAQVVAPALMVLAMIYTIGDVSGAHINPAATFAFALRGAFPWRKVPGYWVVQLGGAVLAAVALRLSFGNVGHLGATLPHHGLGSSLFMETLLTTVLVTVILGTAHAHRVVGHNAGLAVSGVVALAGLFASPISGASMNPARSFGPALVGGSLGVFWIYLVGPMVGALVGVCLARVLHGHAGPHERAAATGRPAPSISMPEPAGQT
jgi:aquaporin Z